MSASQPAVGSGKPTVTTTVIPGKTVTSFSSYSSSSNKTTTITRDGKPVTTSESVQSSSTTTGEGFPEGFQPGAGFEARAGFSTNMGQFMDNFEELKKSVLTGDAYKRSERINTEITAQPGQQHYKPQLGETTICPTKTYSVSTSSVSSGYSSAGGGPLSPPGSQTSSAPLSPSSVAGSEASTGSSGSNGNYG